MPRHSNTVQCRDGLRAFCWAMSATAASSTLRVRCRTGPSRDGRHPRTH